LLPLYLHAHCYRERTPFVDFLCERIMDGQDFIMDEQLVRLSEKC